MMGNSASGNFKSNVGSVDIELDFAIDPERGQDELRSSGYFFNEQGECRNIETNDRVGRFPSQQKYEEFGAALERYIFFLLRDQYKMIEKIINSTSQDDTDSEDDAQPETKIDSKSNDDDDDENDQKQSDTTTDADHENTQSNSEKPENADNNQLKKKPEKNGKPPLKPRATRSKIDANKLAKARIYLSPNYGEKRTLLLLIPGSGAVRAGQWARSICINDNLAAGTMYPFIAEAYKRDWGVILFDPNGRTDHGRIYSDEHVMFVYERWVEKRWLSRPDCAIENVLIVCHSAGGMATTQLLNRKTKYLLPRIRGVAGTDTFFGRASSKQVQAVYRRYIVNWVTSSADVGTKLSDTVPKRVSAGHTAHEYTSAAAFKHIFSFFDAMLKMHKSGGDSKKKDVDSGGGGGGGDGNVNEVQKDLKKKKDEKDEQEKEKEKEKGNDKDENEENAVAEQTQCDAENDQNQQTDTAKPKDEMDVD